MSEGDTPHYPFWLPRSGGAKRHLTGTLRMMLGDSAAAQNGHGCCCIPELVGKMNSD